jgi:hypothetical protein
MPPLGLLERNLSLSPPWLHLPVNDEEILVVTHAEEPDDTYTINSSAACFLPLYWGKRQKSLKLYSPSFTCASAEMLNRG